MHLALAHNQAVDGVALWFAANQAGYCIRMRATITAAACTANQKQSSLDNRCTGCRGLFDQIAPVVAAALPFASLNEVEEAAPASEDSGDWQNPDSQDRLDLTEDELDELLSEYFPDETTDRQEQEQRERIYLDDPPDARPRRVPVYIGRCARCRGYMINALERYDGIKDDNVYRCCSCGWRTSPGYEINRAIHAKGGL